MTNGINEKVLSQVFDRKYRQIYIDFNYEPIAWKYIAKYGIRNVLFKRRVNTRRLDKLDIHKNFIYGEKEE